MDELSREGFRALIHKRYKAEKGIMKSMWRDTLPRDLCNIILEYSRVADMCLDPGYFKGREFKYCGLIGKDIQLGEDDPDEYGETNSIISITTKRYDDPQYQYQIDPRIPSDWIRSDHTIISLLKYLAYDKTFPGSCFQIDNNISVYPPSDDQNYILSKCGAFAISLLLWQSPP